MAKQQEYSIEKLPEVVADWARAVPQVANALLKASAHRLLEQDVFIGDTLLLRGIKFRWRYFIVKDGEKGFCFFVKNVPGRVVFKTLVSFEVGPVIAEPRISELTLEQIDHRIILPPFVVVRPTEDQLKESKGMLGNDADLKKNSVLFMLGPHGEDLLAVKNPEGGIEGARICYKHDGKDEEVRQSGNKLWPLAPFLALIDAIQSWAAGDFETGHEEALTPPKPEDATECARILNRIIRAYCEAVNEVDNGSRPVLSDLLEKMQTRYGVRDFRADVILQLRPDGTLAGKDEEEEEKKDEPERYEGVEEEYEDEYEREFFRDEKEEEEEREGKKRLFQLLMRVRLRPHDQGERATVAIGPPDFLVSGDLFNEFWKSLLEEDVIKRLGDELGVTEEDIRSFIKTYGLAGSVFRVNREDGKDTDILILSGLLADRCRLVILRGIFEVKATVPEVKVLRRKIIGTPLIKRVFVGEPDPAAFGLDTNTVEYFLELITAIKRWVGVLPS